MIRYVDSILWRAQSWYGLLLPKRTQKNVRRDPQFPYTYHSDRYCRRLARVSIDCNAIAYICGNKIRQHKSIMVIKGEIEWMSILCFGRPNKSQSALARDHIMQLAIVRGQTAKRSMRVYEFLRRQHKTVTYSIWWSRASEETIRDYV